MRISGTGSRLQETGTYLVLSISEYHEVAYRAQKLKRVDEFAGIVQKRNGKKITRHDIRQDYTSLFIDPISLGRITSVLSFFFPFFFKRTAGGTRILFYVHSVIYDCIFLNFFFFFLTKQVGGIEIEKSRKTCILGEITRILVSYFSFVET